MRASLSHQVTQLCTEVRRAKGSQFVLEQAAHWRANTKGSQFVAHWRAFVGYVAHWRAFVAQWRVKTKGS